jgi:hypothetical protein
MRMKEGNNQHLNIEGSIGIIASRLLIEGPINKGKTAFILSGRRTYIDALVRPFLKAENKAGYYFYDLNAKINHEINQKHHIYMSSYFGRDKASSTSTSAQTHEDGSQSEFYDKAGINWGNAIVAARWNYRINPKMFSNTTVTYSQYLFEVYYKSENNYIDNGIESYSKSSFLYFSGINDWTVKSDLTYLPNSNHTMKFGFGDIYHTFKPGVTTFSDSFMGGSSSDTLGADFHYAHELSLYFENDHKISNRLKANYGLHHSSFFVGEKRYDQLQPRIAMNYVLNDKSSLKLGYSRTAQFLHLLSNSGIGLPTDLWVPATERIAPITSDQICLGFNQEIRKKYNLVIEGYYKTMNNIIQYKEGSSFFSEDLDWQNKVEVGRGWSYGGEFLLEKKMGKLTGWIGYTLSWTERQFENINFGETFPYRYDRRNDASLVLTYELNKTWDFGLVFVFGTGNAVTLATQTYGVASNPFVDYYSSNLINYGPSINNYRMPNYHRMDIGANRTKVKKWGETVTSFSIYNVYNRRNAYYLAVNKDENNVSSLVQYSLFPIIPSISWKFKFDFEKMKQTKTNP